jgi:hypothetical protein
MQPTIGRRNALAGGLALAAWALAGCDTSTGVRLSMSAATAPARRSQRLFAHPGLLHTWADLAHAHSVAEPERHGRPWPTLT